MATCTHGLCVCDGCLFLLPAIPPSPDPPLSPVSFWWSLDPATARPSRERGRIWKKDSLSPPSLLLGSVGSFQDRETETEIRSHMHPGKKHVAKGVGRDDLPCLTWGNIGEGSGILDILTDCRLLVKNHPPRHTLLHSRPAPPPSILPPHINDCSSAKLYEGGGGGRFWSGGIPFHHARK